MGRERTHRSVEDLDAEDYATMRDRRENAEAFFADVLAKLDREDLLSHAERRELKRPKKTIRKKMQKARRR